MRLVLPSLSFKTTMLTFAREGMSPGFQPVDQENIGKTAGGKGVEGKT